MPNAPTPPIKDIVITSDDPELVEILKEIKQILDIREGRLGDTGFRFIDYYELIELLAGDETITITVLPGAHNHPHNDLTAIQGGQADQYYHLTLAEYGVLDPHPANLIQKFDTKIEIIDTGLALWSGQIFTTVDGVQVGEFWSNYQRLGQAAAANKGALEVYSDPPQLFWQHGLDTYFHIANNLVEFGSATENMILNMSAQTFEFELNNIDMFEISTSGVKLRSGAWVDDIETTLTDDDTHLPTSGAVFDAIAAHIPDKIAEGDSSVEVIDTGTGQVDITVDTALILRALVDRLQFPIGLLETNTGTPLDLTINCGTDKTVKLTEGVWKDINVGGAQLNPIPAFAPDLEKFADEGGGDTGIYTLAFAVGESASGSFEIQHDYKEGTDISFHIHWQGKAAPTGTDNVKWELTYTIVRFDATIDAATVIVEETPIDTQYKNNTSVFPIISGSTGGNNGGPIQMGDQFLLTVKRVVAAGDAYTGDALVLTAGLHYQVDTVGSRQIGAK